MAGASGFYGQADVALARYNTDGSLDTSFGTDGKVATDLGTGVEQAEDMVLQQNGKIVVVGRYGDTGPDFVVARYNADGSLDTTFGSGGKVITNFETYSTGWTSSDWARAVALQGDKIVVAGYSQDKLALVRYNADGSLDASFGSGGKVVSSSDPSFTAAEDVAVLSDGKIVTAGYDSNSSGGENGTGYDFDVRRYNSDGSPDLTFGGDGRVTTNFSAGSPSYNAADKAYSLAVQEDGRLLVGGMSQGSSSYNFALTRYNTDGSLDTSFGAGGSDGDGVIIRGAVYSGGWYGIALQADGKIVTVGGESTIGRFRPDGTPDPTFGFNGIKSSYYSEFGVYYHDVALQQDGKIIVGGQDNAVEKSDFYLARLFGGDDNVKPVTSTTPSQQPNAAGWHKENVMVTLSATDNDGGSGVKEISYKINGGEPTTVQGNSAQVPVTAEGTTTIAYHATDNSGNIEMEKTFTVKMDKTAPRIECGAPDDLWRAQDVSIACTATDGFSGLSDAADAGFSLSTSVPPGTETANAQTNSRQVSDRAGNAATAGSITGIKVDKKDPSVNCGTADALWHKEDVSITCTASDNGSGLANASDASFSLRTSVAANTETADARTATREVPDAVGNTEAAGPISGNKVDKKAPEISVSTPAEGAEYALNAAVASDYACADGGSGAGSCAGPVASGANIDTSSVGPKTFVVEATDKAGNTATLSRGYTVRDNALPETTISSGPAGLTNDRTPTFGFGGSDNVTPVAELLFSYKVDGGEWSAYSRQRSATLGGTGGLSQGRHTFYVKAKDTAGNEDPTAAARKFTVDSVKPRGTVKINGGAATTKSLRVRLALRARDPAPASGVAQMRFSNDGRRWSGWQPYAKSKLWKLKVGKAGTRVVYVQYRDRAGNVSATARDTIKYRR